MDSDLRIVVSKKKCCRNGLRLLSPPSLNFAATINGFNTPSQCCLSMHRVAEGKSIISRTFIEYVNQRGYYK